MLLAEEFVGLEHLAKDQTTMSSDISQSPLVKQLAANGKSRKKCILLKLTIFEIDQHEMQPLNP